MATSIWEHFSILPDPRVERTKLHKLEDILTIAICAMICGAETWVDIADFGRAKEAWLRTFLELPHGIPSHDTFGRFFAILDPRGFERCFQSWIATLAGSSAAKLIAIDGKAIRRSLDRASGKAAIHMVTAWVHENHAAFGQLRTEDKSNEITAIPQLLEMLNLEAATVTIDAIGCQKDIAQKVLDKDGQYVLAVKSNQETLYEDIRLFLDDAVENDFRGIEHDLYEQTEKGHGRIEMRGVGRRVKRSGYTNGTTGPGCRVSRRWTVAEKSVAKSARNGVILSAAYLDGLLNVSPWRCGTTGV